MFLGVGGLGGGGGHIMCLCVHVVFLSNVQCSLVGFLNSASFKANIVWCISTLSSLTCSVYDVQYVDYVHHLDQLCFHDSESPARLG